MATSDDAPNYIIGPLLQRAHRHAADAFNRALVSLEIQGRHFAVLMALDRLGSTSQARLVEHLGAEKSAMVRMIDDLESRGLVERGADPADRRALPVTLTASGAETFAAASAIAARVADDLLDGFDAGERVQLRALLTRFVGASPGVSP
ncbi:MarR family transcriptional regulator [Tsukamurella sp. 8F]|uniref:MarR family winged helix-turn-helix transcriptional regulator n=1 Tax=unclassified Tsukamurella TaxID=2633480 RepID=UPI0023B94F14|nr:MULTISPECIES: MarR family transcriptional regulator [unclassified Tsukamurella]MDF0531051.1 MarR family transcriptional regulator [Tsukamurella sp. 8J]MDF0585482.1 MarR family transcriptional regulator [Tsukamurella sp. 8F]